MTQQSLSLCLSHDDHEDLHITNRNSVFSYVSNVISFILFYFSHACSLI